MPEKTKHGTAMKQYTMSMGDSFPGGITKERAQELGISEWRPSDATVKRIEAIESNIRLSESLNGNILVS